MVKSFSSYNTKDMLYNHTVKDNPNDIDFNFHTHDVCEMIFLKSGNVTAVIDSKEYKMYENSLVIFNPNVVHRIKIEDSTPYERHGILFDEKKIGSVPYLKFDKSLHVIDFSSNSYMIDIFKKLDYYNNNLGEEDFSVILKNAIEEILYNLTLIKPDDSSRDYNVINPVINGAIEYIEKNYKKQISIDDICSNLFISKCHLHHLFMNLLKVSPKKYINTKRLTEARNLIRSGKKPNDIYSLCGFSDYGTFYRNYKNHFGHIPSKENEYEIERKMKS